jgi:hypothetical protein
MSTIFSDAKRVVVWLGPAYERSDEAMRALSTPSDLHLPATLGDPDIAKAIEALFVRPYWSRLWIYQELKSAKELTVSQGTHSQPRNSQSAKELTVMCGNVLLQWADLELTFITSTWATMFRTYSTLQQSA